MTWILFALWLVGNFVFIEIQNYAKESKEALDPFMPEIRTFTTYELAVDSDFIVRLHDIVLNMKSISYGENVSIWLIDKENADYFMLVSIGIVPCETCDGYVEYEGLTYWLKGYIPNEIILGQKLKRRITYKWDLVQFYDPSYWVMSYDTDTGEIRSKLYTGTFGE